MEYYSDSHKYDDIINTDYKPAQGRIHMSIHDRAAQFNPFAALTGHDDAVEKTAQNNLARAILNDTNEIFYEDC